MADRRVDRLVVGGGIVGLGVAREMLLRRPGLRLILVEKEPALAQHQTGHNSGVIHSGVYYRPGSLKARLCLEGRLKLLRFCEEKGVPHRITGKLIVAAAEREIPVLSGIFVRGKTNGVKGLEMLDADEIKTREPHARGYRALWVPSAGVVDYRAVAAALGCEIRELGGEILLGQRVERVGGSDTAKASFATSTGSIAAKKAVVCGGLQSDRLVGPSVETEDLRIIPFRGDYYLLRPEARALIRSMIYPVPDPRFPFLGVHFTRSIDGDVLAGPNAVLTLSREGYGRFRVQPRDGWSTLSWPGFWRLARRHWRTGVGELWRDCFKRSYLRSLQKFVPDIGLEDLLPGPSGIRAQAVRRDGSLADDFVILQSGEVTHVLNAPSPAATSCLAIASEIVDRVEGQQPA